jgi:hypothetical protein
MICNPKKIKGENDIFTNLILISTIYVFRMLLQFEKSYEDEWIFVYGHASKIGPASFVSSNTYLDNSILSMTWDWSWSYGSNCMVSILYTIRKACNY